MKLTQEEMEERRQTIVMTAFKLFCERGIESTSLLEIAKNANVGETTIYRYFENKTMLVLEAFIRLWDMIMSEVEEAAESSNDYSSLSGYGQISVWLDAFQLLYQNNANFILFSYEAKLYLLRHNIRLDPNQQDILMHTVRVPCLAAVEKGKRDGSIPTDEDSEDIFFALWGTVRGYIVKIVIYGALYGEDSPWESRYDIMKKGILCALSHGWKPLITE